MAERLTPPVRYPRYGEEPAENNVNRKSKRESKKSAAPRASFRKSKISEYLITGGFDVPFFALTMLLLAIGLVMLLSASYPTAYFSSDNSYSFFIKQGAFAVVGVIAMLFASKLDYKIYKDLIKFILPATLLLLVVVLFYNTGKSTTEGEVFRRYIPVMGGITFQPSEIGKFTLIITLATYFCKYGNRVRTFKYGIFYPLIVIGVFCALIALENHVSCIILMFLIGATIMFAGGTRSWLFWLGVIAIVAVVIVVFMFPDILPEYVEKKLIAFTDKDYQPLGGRWQINNSLYA
ncbi:MAG: FtsW/RodA/SpoVE family cell cycle protein, partial [Eubacterium sp.]|nr:FtsW/RodA/SpoVE family cell cycle protein [Eubacterium sp.]